DLPFVDNVTALAFSPDGQTLVCGTARAGKLGAALQFWDVTTGKKKFAPVKDLEYAITRVRFSPAGSKLIYANAATPECRVVDMASRQVEKINGLAGNTTFTVSRQGMVAVAANKDSRILLWNPGA